MNGLDYSAGAIPGATIRAAGYGFVIRYVDSPALIGTKHITPAEYRDLRAAGLAVYLVFEIDTTDVASGYAGGVAHAQRALAGAAWVGYPPGGLVFMACDEHLLASQIPGAIDYLRGAQSVLGHAAMGVYGFTELIDACRAAVAGSVFWQCGVSPAAGSCRHFWQRNTGITTTVLAGVECDINDQLLPLPSPVVPAASEVEPVAANIVMNPDGTFRGVVNAEAGKSSAVFSRGWVTITTSWGAAEVRWSCHQDMGGGLTGVIAGQQKDVQLFDNGRTWITLPSGCVKVTVEGKVADPAAGTLVCAEWIPAH